MELIVLMSSKPKWNWQQTNWPHFSYDPEPFEAVEHSFIEASGRLLGLSGHIDEESKTHLMIEALSQEALTTSEIEGDFLNRDSVQASLRRRFGLIVDHRRIPPAEDGIAELLTDLLHSYNQDLTHEHLFRWHVMLMKGRRDLDIVGAYRTHEDPMVIVSGRVDEPNIHFEAPPSRQIKEEMDKFLSWYASTGPRGTNRMNMLVRASIVHLYFVCIHPFEDGNGRIARALVTRSLAESLGRFSLLALSETILLDRKQYYQMLENNNKSLAIHEWIDYFTACLCSAQQRSLEAYEFLIKKTKLFDRFRDRLNTRQIKLLERVFREGPKGFEGGISAEKYISITKASRATATRDLTELSSLGILQKSGVGKGTRYQLRLKQQGGD
jgi:Fic family protein